jgi:predicted oxidoreductase
MPVSSIKLADDGPEFSRIVYGLWRLDEWDMSRFDVLNRVEECLDLGITTFDHADIYGDYENEAIFGQALHEQPNLREKIEIVTKCGIKLISDNRPDHGIKHYDTSKDHIIDSVNSSLNNLHTDYIDLLLIHRPDPLMNAELVAEAFHELKAAGKVLHFGVSNFTPYQFDLLESRLNFPLVTNQIELSVMNFDALHDGTVDQCQAYHMPPMAWSPFGGGDLFVPDDPKPKRVRKALEQVAAEFDDASIDQIALAWLLRHPANIIPIIGTGNSERIKSAAGSEEFILSREQWFQIWEASAGHEVP